MRAWPAASPKEIVVEFGFEVAGRKCVDTDAVARPFQRQRLGHLHDAGLRDRIRSDGTCNPQPRIDATLTIEPFTLCATMRRPTACATSQTPFRLVSTTLSQSALVLLQGRSCRRHTGIVDDDLDRAEPRFGGVQRGLDARCDGDVHHDALGLPAGSRISSTVFAKASARRAATVTRAPRRREEGCKKTPEAA